MSGLRDPLLRAWLVLLALSGLSSVIAARPPGLADMPRLAGAAVLLAAGIKARTILLHYLGLARVPAWRRAFTALLVLLLALLLTLFLAV